MLIHSFSAKNFKAIKNIQLDNLSQKRIILFYGDNGQGKSSILEAFRYGFTNILPERTKIENYINWDGAKKFDLNFKFNHANSYFDYSLEGAKSTSKKLKIKNKDEEKEYINSAATAVLSSYINPVLTNYSAILEQGNSSALLFEKPAERLKKFKEILSIEEIDELVKLLKQDITELDKQVIELQTINKTLESLDYTLHNIPVHPEDVIDDLKKQQESLFIKKLEYENNLKEYNNYLELFDEYRKKQTELKNKQTEIITYKQEIEDIIKELDELTGIPFNEQEYINKKQEFSDLEKQEIIHNNNLKQYENIKKQIKDLYNAREIKNASLFDLQLERLKSLPENYEKVVRDWEEELNKFTACLITLEKEKQLVEQGKCDKCGQDYKGNLEEKQQQIESIKFSIEEITVKLETLKQDIQDYLNTVRNNTIIENKKQKLQEEIINITSSVESLEKTNILETSFNKEQLTKLEEELALLNAQYAKYHQIKKQQERKQQELNTLNIKLSSLEGQCQEIAKIREPREVFKPEMFNYDQYQEILNKIDNYNNTMQEINRLLSLNKSIIEQKKKNEKTINNNLDKIIDIKKQISIKAESKELLEKNFASWLITSGATQIKNKMNNFFQRTYGRYELFFEQTNTSIDFFYKNPKFNTIQPISMASGYEKQNIALANRIALCSLQNLGFMILDEVDDAGSSSNSVTLFEELFEEKSINQFLVVTHNEETKEMILSRSDSIGYCIQNGSII